MAAPTTLNPQSQKVISSVLSSAPISAPLAPPPPYTPSINPWPGSENDDDDEDGDEDALQPVPITITVDASTHITGHCNTIQLSPLSESSTRLAGLITVAMKQAGVSGERSVNVKVQAGLSIHGSQNLVLCAGNGAKKISAAKAIIKAWMKGNRDLVARKRRAVSVRPVLNRRSL